MNRRFNQRVDTWDTSAVTGMWAMFGHASSFNQPMNTWDTSAVTNMERMFMYAQVMLKQVTCDIKIFSPWACGARGVDRWHVETMPAAT